MALRKSISIDDPMSQIPYEERVRMAIEKQQAQQAQEASMFSGSNKWLLIGGLAVAAYLAFGPQPKKGKSSGLNGPKRKKGKGKKKK